MLARICRLCDKRVVKSERKDHNCNIIESNWCDEHKVSAYQITDSRISNYEECKKHIDLFRCLLCRNLVKQPLACKKCKANFCKVCLGQALFNKKSGSAFCPECYSSDAQFQSLSKNLLNILNQAFKITCKNKDDGCDRILTIDELQSHEYQCEKCPDCKVMCTRCENPISPNDFESHQCSLGHIPPAESINAHQEEDIGNSMNDSFINMPQPPALAINGGDNEPLIHRPQPGYCRRIK